MRVTVRRGFCTSVLFINILLALGRSLSLSICAVVNIDLCFCWFYYSVGNITVRKAWVSGESSPVIKDSLTHHPWFSRPGHPSMPRSCSNGTALHYCFTSIFLCCCAAMDVICNLLHGWFYIAQTILIPFYTVSVVVISPPLCISSHVFCKSQVSPYVC